MTLRIAHHSNRDDSNNIKKSKFLPGREITGREAPDDRSEITGRSSRRSPRNRRKILLIGANRREIALDARKRKTTEKKCNKGSFEFEKGR